MNKILSCYVFCFAKRLGCRIKMINNTCCINLKLHYMIIYHKKIYMKKY